MAFRRRFGRRKRRLQWFPPIGSRFTVGESTDTLSATTFAIGVDIGGAEVHAELGLTYDFTQERLLTFASAGAATSTPTVTLADMMSQAWRPRRILGQVNAHYFTAGEGAGDVLANAPPGCLFGAGLMVRGVGAGQAQLPLGDASPLLADDNTDPWIWRRVWVLGQGQMITREGAGLTNLAGFRASAGVVSDTNSSFANFPRGTWMYGTNASNHIIDQQTNRVIGPEERLILHIATKALPFTEAFQTGAGVAGVFDFRFLGSLMKVTNRRNASRP